jgi:hypothetical protein
MAWLEAPDTCRGMKGGTKSEAKAKTCTIAAGNEPRVKSKKERKDWNKTILSSKQCQNNLKPGCSPRILQPLMIHSSLKLKLMAMLLLLHRRRFGHHNEEICFGGHFENNLSGTQAQGYHKQQPAYQKVKVCWPSNGAGSNWTCWGIVGQQPKRWTPHKRRQKEEGWRTEHIERLLSMPTKIKQHREAVNAETVTISNN